MALTPRLSQGPRLGTIPLPERAPSITDGVGSVVNALGDARERGRQASRREADIAHEVAMREQAERRQTQVSQGIMAMESGRVEFERQRDERRKGADLTRYRADSGEAWSAWSTDFLANLPNDPEVRQHFTAPLARMGATYIRDDDRWLMEQNAALDASALGDMASAHAVEAMGSYRDAAAMESRRATFMEFLTAKGLDPKRHAVAVDAYEKGVRRAVIDGAENSGDYAAMRALASDAGFMTPMGQDYADNVLDRAGAGERQAAAALAAEQAAAREAAADEMDRIEAIIGEGGIVSQKEIEAAAAAATAAGVDADRRVKFGGTALTQNVNRMFGPAADPDGSRGRAELARLNGIAASRGLTSEENMVYQRVMAAQGKRRADDAALLKPLAGKSAAGDMTVLGEIAKRPRAERFGVAEQVRPGMGYLSKLGSDMQADALQGHYDLKASPDLIKQKRGPQGGMSDPTPAAMRQHVGAMIATGAMSEGELESYRSLAAALYVSFQKKKASSGWEPELFARAANIAMGARRGADGQWRGGMGLINDRHVWLPDWASAGELNTLIARNPFANATYDGATPVDKRDVLASFTPILERGGGQGEAAYYIFVNAAGQELKRKGTREPYRMLVAR